MPRQQGSRGGLQLTVSQLFNEAQRVNDKGQRRFAGLVWELYAEDAQGTFDQLLACVKWILKAEEKNVYNRRAVEFVGVVAGQARDTEQVELVESLVGELVGLADAAEHVARWRACELLAAVMLSFSAEDGLSVEVLGALQEAMLERLDDAKPAVRAAAARALRRLPEAGEDGDYGECEVTGKLLDVLANEKSKEVRKALLASLPLLAPGGDDSAPRVSTVTVPALLERTLDEADEVRAVVYTALKDAVRLQDLGLEQRLLVLRRGLSDRQPAVSGAATKLLLKWITDACHEDVFELLGQLEVQQNPDVGETVVRALLSSGALDAAQLCKRAAETQDGLQRDFRQGELFSPQEALFWRVLCEDLNQAAASKGLAAAAAAGDAERQIERADAESRYAALEEVLPETAEEMAGIIAAHAAGGGSHRFATCQLMLLAGACMDFADAANRKAAATMLFSLLTEVPSEEACAKGSAATGAAQLWHQALAQLLRKVHSDPVEMADALLTACGQLADSATAVDAAGDDSTSAWLQALAAAALLLDLLPDARPAQRALAGFHLLDVLQAVVLPALAHEAVLARREAVRCLGLYCLLDGIPTQESLGDHVDVLRCALLGWHSGSTPAEVATVAAQALGDLAVRKGIKNLDGLKDPAAAPANPALDPELCQQPLLGILLGVLGHWEELLEQRWQEGEAAPKRRRGRAAQGEEGELQLGAALVEALVRLVLHNDAWGARAGVEGHRGLEDSEVIQVLARLLLLHFHPATEPAAQLRQCLAVFFDVFAAAPAPAPLPGLKSGRDYLADVFIPAARRAALMEREWEQDMSWRITVANCVSAKVMRFLLQLLEAPAYGPGGKDGVVGQAALLCRLLAEVGTTACRDLSKPHKAAMCKVALRLPLASDPESQVAVRQARALALSARDAVADRLMRKDLEGVVERLGQLDSGGEALGGEELEELRERLEQEAQAWGPSYQLPAEAAAERAPAKTPARGKTPAARGGSKRKAGGGAAASTQRESEDEESDDDQTTQRGAPTPATRRMPTRAARARQSYREQKEEEEEEGSESSEDESEEEGASENVRRGGAKSRGDASPSVSEVRRALQENRIS